MSDTATHTIVLKAGESFTLPPSSELIFVSDPDSLDSDCVDIPTTTYKCGYFFLILDADDNANHSMDMNTKYYSIKLNSTLVDTLDEFVLYGDGNHPTPTSIAALNLRVDDLTLFEFMQITTNEVTSRIHLHVYFKVIDTFYDTLRLVINNNNLGSLQEYAPLDAECDAYEDPS